MRGKARSTSGRRIIDASPAAHIDFYKMSLAVPA
jgi:hypothetical protein